MRAHLCVYIRFVNVVSYLLPKLHGMLKTHCLECVFSRAEVIPDIYLLLKTKGFDQIMAHRFAPYTHTHTYMRPGLKSMVNWRISSVIAF